MGELDDYLNGIDAETTPAEPTGEPTPPAPTEPAPSTPEPAPPAEPQQGASQPPRDERGRFVAKADEPPAAPEGAPAPPSEHVPQTVPVQVMLEERRRRQEAEARWAQAQQQQAPQITDDTFYASPVAASQHMIGQQSQALSQQIQNIRYELAEDFTRAQHEDYDGVRDAFIAKYEARDPWAIAVATQMGAMPNPAKFVYEQTKRQMTIGDDPQAYESRVRADERAKVLREMQAAEHSPSGTARAAIAQLRTVRGAGHDARVVRADTADKNHSAQLLTEVERPWHFQKPLRA